MSLELPEYTIRRAPTKPGLDGQWDGPAWKSVEPLAVTHYHAASSDHHPPEHFASPLATVLALVFLAMSLRERRAVQR